MNFIWQDIGGSSDSVNVIYYWMERAVSTVNFLCYCFLISCCISNSLSFSFIAICFLLLLLPLFLLTATCWCNCSFGVSCGYFSITVYNSLCELFFMAGHYYICLFIHRYINKFVNEYMPSLFNVKKQQFWYIFFFWFFFPGTP